MRVPFYTTCFLACLASRVSADEAMTPETLSRIKHATVFVKVEVKGLNFSGSGFVVQTDGGTALLVTNHHVIEPKVEIEAQPRPHGRHLPPGLTPRSIVATLRNAAVTVVLDSGTKTERSARAEVLAVDPEYDLAVLRVRNVPDLPEPIDLGKVPELAETMPVYTFGFPFGKALAAGKGNPAVTVGKGTISSLRQNDDGELAVVQIDGSLNPGNSGGPVVNAHGQLVGVAVATIRDSTGIGLAIPPGQVGQMLGGRLGSFHIVGNPGAKPSVNLEVSLIDPLNKIRSVTLHCVPASQAHGDLTNPKTVLPELPGCRKVALKLERQLATGTLDLPGAGQEEALFLQAVYEVAGGAPRRTKGVREPLQAAPVARAAPEPPKGRREPGMVSPAGETKILGGAFDLMFKDQAPRGGLLVGFQIGLGRFVQNDIIAAVRPIYRAAGLDTKGKPYGTNWLRSLTVKAKPGYAVGGITAKAGLTVDGFRITFMHVRKDGTLDPKDSYQSAWIGGPGGGRETELGGDGTPVVGIVGKVNQKDCTGLGLILKKD